MSLLIYHNWHDHWSDTFPKKTLHKISRNHHLKFLEISTRITLPKTNVEPGTPRLWKGKTSGNHQFGGPMFVFRRVYWIFAKFLAQLCQRISFVNSTLDRCPNTHGRPLCFHMLLQALHKEVLMEDSFRKCLEKKGIHNDIWWLHAPEKWNSGTKTRAIWTKDKTLTQTSNAQVPCV